MNGKIFVERVRFGDVELVSGSGDPSGAVSAPLGSLYARNDAAIVYQNTDGATTWVPVAGSGVVPTGLRRTVQFMVLGAGGAGTTDSVTSIPAGSQIFAVDVQVTSAFDGGAVIDVGDTAVANRVFDQSQADLAVVGTFSVEQHTAWPLASVVRATLGGVPTTGIAIVTVVYGNVDP
jgi:hypothetical protein